jgi:glycosyltransferase involved in cell wall biosynthesis/SAM-dependent methyltransferase/ADP-heptose:LPS heptosyltransferase
MTARPDSGATDVATAERAEPARSRPRSRRVLALSLDSIGDLVLREPLLSALDAAGYRVTLLTRHAELQGAYAGIARLVRPDDEVLSLPFNPYTTPEAQGIEALRDWAAEHDLASFDVLLSLQFERTYVDAWLRGAMPHASHVALRDASLPSEPSTASDVIVPVSREDHEWEKSRRLAEALIGPVSGWRGPRIELPTEIVEAGRTIVTGLGLRSGEFTACVPAGIGNVAEKVMPADVALAAISEFHDRHGLPPLLIGLPFEESHLRTLAELAAQRGIDARVWIGDATRPDLLAAVIAQSRCYFGIDTGSMHLAGALGKPVLAVFGGGTYPRFMPMAATAYVVTQRLPCFGCNWQCWLDRPACLDTIEPERVRRGVAWVLENEGLKIDEGVPADDPLLIRIVRAGEQSRTRMQASKKVERDLADANADREARLQVIHRLNEELSGLHVERQALQGELATVNADREARLAFIHQQAADIATRDAERAGLQARLASTEAGVEALRAQLAAANADREARLQHIHDLSRELGVAGTEHAADLRQRQALEDALAAANTDRNARLAHIQSLDAELAVAHADRAARLEIIHRLDAELRRQEQLGFKGRLRGLAGYTWRRARQARDRRRARPPKRPAPPAPPATVTPAAPSVPRKPLHARAKHLVKDAAWRLLKGRPAPEHPVIRPRLKAAITKAVARLALGPAAPPMPRITMVTPAFNAAATITDTIESVLRQDYPDLEYIIVDGGSTDGTPDIVKRCAELTDLPQRIARVVSEPDGGMYDAIGKGFAAASGEVFGYLNADDLLEPGALQRVGAFFARQRRASVVYHEDNVLVDGWKFPNVEQPRAVGPWDFMRRHILFQDGVFFRRQAYESIGGVRRDLRFAGDFDLWLRMSSRFRFHRQDGHVSTFRIRAGQLSESMQRYREEMDRALEDWRRATPALLRGAWRIRGAMERVIRRVRRRLGARDLFFPIDFPNLPPPSGIQPPDVVAGRPRSPLDGRAPERLLFSSTDSRFGERIISQVYLDERNRVAVVYPPVDEATLDGLYRKHYSDPLKELVLPPPGGTSPYRGFFGGTRLERAWNHRWLRKITHRVKLSWDYTLLPEILTVLLPLGMTADRPLRFLDVGCFEGELLDRLVQLTKWITCGIEPNERAVEIATQKGHTVWRGYAENALDAVTGGALFDIVYMGQSIEHVDDPLLVIRRLRRLLAPGGVVVLSTPNLDARQIRWFGPTWAHWHLPYHRYIFSPQSVRRLAELAGLRLANWRTFSHAYWTTMSLVQNRLGLGAVVSHAITFDHETYEAGVHLTGLARLFWDWRGQGDDLFAVLKDEEA